mmetsp:Transcript_27844/g.59889  ORF Transcript_27844/g.59889 Transcript_27844/m.59889 type:complete len:83 (+) Transcript_27844:55-303(+)
MSVCVPQQYSMHLNLEGLIPETLLHSTLPHSHHIIHTNFSNLVCFPAIESIQDASSMAWINLMLLQSKSDIKVPLKKVGAVG